MLESIAVASVIWWTFMGGLGSSPFLAKLSKFWHAWDVRNSDGYKRLDKLHERYGEYVRLGPEELSITDPKAIEAIYGLRSTKILKPPFYDYSFPRRSLHSARDTSEHDKRRRTAWTRAFSADAIKNYENRVIMYTDKLSAQIDSDGTKPINITKWLAFFAFDLMGDLAFGQSFDSLGKGDFHWGTKLLRDSGRGHVVLGKLPWLIEIIVRLQPFTTTEMQTFYNWCAEQSEKRKHSKSTEKDISSYLLDAEPMSSDPAVNEMWRQEDTNLIVSAGSDTTTEVMSHCFYYLAKQPIHQQRIREELKVFDGRHPTAKEFLDLEYLNGYINENLRLHHPVPCGLPRMTPPEGLQVGDRHIPGNITVCCPQWMTGRCMSHYSASLKLLMCGLAPKTYQRPLEVIPERWYSQPELVINKGAFLPFFAGRWSCVGRPLALFQLQNMITTMVSRYDVAFAPGEDGSGIIERSVDHVHLYPADMLLTFAPRKTE
ncbi:Tryprostatin B 6-hydroxylase [Lachnellula suecica]|uniref:Tryprostatin B 6-hydroxylase n=1 Tax=Lachnellula suecica TaxID=602035 RepID=A0A8T9CJF5_9HELO|nr:Tryprostatin B 6-hydroxylase [Lachnellula suecica]